MKGILNKLFQLIIAHYLLISEKLKLFIRFMYIFFIHHQHFLILFNLFIRFMRTSFFIINDFFKNSSFIIYSFSNVFNLTTCEYIFFYYTLLNKL